MAYDFHKGSMNEFKITGVREIRNIEGALMGLRIGVIEKGGGVCGCMHFPGHDHHSPQEFLDEFGVTDPQDLVGRYCIMLNNGPGDTFLKPSDRQQEMQDVDLSAYCDEAAV